MSSLIHQVGRTCCLKNFTIDSTRAERALDLGKECSRLTTPGFGIYKNGSTVETVCMGGLTILSRRGHRYGA